MYAQLAALLQKWRDAYSAGGFFVLFKIFGEIAIFAQDVLNAADADLDPGNLPALESQLAAIKTSCCGVKACCEGPDHQKATILDPNMIAALVASIISLIQMIINRNKPTPVPAA